MSVQVDRELLRELAEVLDNDGRGELASRVAAALESPEDHELAAFKVVLDAAGLPPTIAGMMDLQRRAKGSKTEVGIEVREGGRYVEIVRNGAPAAYVVAADRSPVELVFEPPKAGGSPRTFGAASGLVVSEEPDAAGPCTCPRCGAHDDPNAPSPTGPFVDNLGDGEHVCCMRCGLVWQPFGEHEWPCAVCCPEPPVEGLLNMSLVDQVVHLRRESRSFETRWREAGERAFRECGRRQQLEADLKELLATEHWHVGATRAKLQGFLESGSLGPGHELAVPLSRAMTPGAREVIRVWRIKDELMVVLDTRAGEDREYQNPSIWGEILHDVATHVGNFYVSRMRDPDGKPAELADVLEIIEKAFMDESREPLADVHEDLSD